MTRSQLSRLSGMGLWVGAVTFIVHIGLRSVITAGPDPAAVVREGLWVPINALGLLGAALVLLGLPAMYARIAALAGLPGLLGTVLIAVAWMFWGVFLSFYSVLVVPWLAEKAPALVAASAPLPTGFLITFIAGLIAWLVGTVLLAIPFLRGRVQLPLDRVPAARLGALAGGREPPPRAGRSGNQPRDQPAVEPRTGAAPGGARLSRLADVDGARSSGLSRAGRAAPARRWLCAACRRAGHRGRQAAVAQPLPLTSRCGRL